mgnify:FL=1
MIPIKFRGWDNQEEIMISNIHESDLWMSALSGNYILMQFTGLLDKQGKEIYEGDILEADSSYHVWGGKKLSKFIGVVKWDNEKTGYYCSFKDTNRSDFDIPHIEVIGNIYENPELIKSN